MKAMDYPYIRNLRRRVISLVMEESRGRDLFSRLSEKSKDGRVITESYIRTLFREMVLAVNYLHQHDVLKRYLKQESTMFANNQETSSL